MTTENDSSIPPLGAACQPLRSHVPGNLKAELRNQSPILIERKGVTCELWNCDCMEYLRTLKDKAFELAIADPPYGIEKHGGETGKNWKRYEVKDWDFHRPDNRYFSELFRVSTNQIIWGANYFTSFLPISMGWIVWDKGQDLDSSDCELAYTSFDCALRRKIINRCKIGDFGGFIHPTQKPVALYSWLLANYAKPGDRILDTHLGSGSIAIACLNHGFNLTACELDKDYFEAAVDRIQREAAQGVLI